jgi:ribosomal protein S18 acetylase RimI-like enzyme
VGIICYLNKATEDEIAEHLAHCDAEFVPPLSSRLRLSDYARKVAFQATRFEAWSENTMVGLVAAYCNDHETRTAYITSVSVLKEWARKGIARKLMRQCIKHVQSLGLQQIMLEVSVENRIAIRLYEEEGFAASNVSEPVVVMKMALN